MEPLHRPPAGAGHARLALGRAQSAQLLRHTCARLSRAQTLLSLER